MYIVFMLPPDFTVSLPDLFQLDLVQKFPMRIASMKNEHEYLKGLR